MNGQRDEKEKGINSSGELHLQLKGDKEFLALCNRVTEAEFEPSSL